jgi:hypothetical protein
MMPYTNIFCSNIIIFKHGNSHISFYHLFLFSSSTSPFQKTTKNQQFQAPPQLFHRYSYIQVRTLSGWLRRLPNDAKQK